MIGNLGKVSFPSVTWKMDCSTNNISCLYAPFPFQANTSVLMNLVAPYLSAQNILHILKQNTFSITVDILGSISVNDLPLYRKKKTVKKPQHAIHQKRLNKAITKQKHDNNPQNSQRMLMQGIIITYCGT